VIARDGMTADSVATAASVLGSERGQRLLRSVAAEIRWVEETGAGVAVRETSQFSRYLRSGGE
jgi:thiamine biosynthesis lipoprotein ApbE